MFCSKCGTENRNDSDFCVSCGNPNSTESIQGNGASTASKSIPEIWTPNATANWSLLFTPAFGSFLQARNWKELNQSSKAKFSMAWFFLSLLAPIVFIELAGTQYLAGFAFWYLVIWYVFSGRKQGKYVKDTHGDSFKKKGWGMPLVLAIVILLVFAALLPL